MAIQPTMAGGGGSKGLAKEVNEDYAGEIGEVLGLYSGVRPDGGRRSVESTLNRNAPLKQQYKHSGRDSFDAEGSSRTAAARVSIPDHQLPPSQEHARIDTLAGAALTA